MFEKELNKLIESEDNIECIKDIISNDISNTEQNKEYIERLLEFSTENKLYRSEAWGYYFKGWHYIDNSEYEKAVENFMISYELFDKLNNKYEIAYACNGLTNVYCLMGQYKLSNEWGLKGISFCEETKNSKAMIILLINICINYIKLSICKALEIESIEEIDYDLTKSRNLGHVGKSWN